VTDAVAARVAAFARDGKTHLPSQQCDKCLKLGAAPRMFRRYARWKAYTLAKIGE
jgi:hypothetical protein